MDVLLGECDDVFFLWVDLIFAQNIANNRAIGFSSNFNILQIVFRPESIVQGSFQRFDPGPSGIDQRVVNVEKEQALFCHVERSRDISDYFLKIARDSSTSLCFARDDK